MGDWSKLPEELLGLIALRLYSVIELIRFRSICKSWRSSASGVNKNHSLSSPLIYFKPLQIILARAQANGQILSKYHGTVLSRATFFRVTLASSPDQGWLIKSDTDLKYRNFHLLNCLSRKALGRSRKLISLSEFIVSEIQESYAVVGRRTRETASEFKRVFLVRVQGGDHRVLVIGIDGKIRFWKGGIWNGIKKQVAQFSDFVLDEGLTYAVDTKGIMWWISSAYDIIRYGTKLHENITNGSCGEKRFVRCRGELYIVDRLIDENLLKRKADSYDDNAIVHFRNADYTNADLWEDGNGNDDFFAAQAHRFIHVLHDNLGNVSCKPFERDPPKTIGFKVYKNNEELLKWVEVKSLGDKAIVIATDACFSVSAHEFYGCLPNSIYFTDKKEEEVKVFKLDDGSITTMSESEQSCFQMFVPSFL
ncbi:F-box protein [Arabidopsis thaliana]